MSSSLLVISASFPFGDRADFLEDEITWLSSTFDRVVLLPLVPKGEIQSTPANVEVDLSLARRLGGRVQRVASAFRSFRSLRLTREAIRTEGRPPSLECWLRLLVAAGIAEQVHRWSDRNATSRPDLALTIWAGPATLGAARSGLITLTRAHGGDLYAERHTRGYFPMQRLALASAEAVHPVSLQGVHYLQERFPDLAERISVRHLGVQGAARISSTSNDGVVRIASCSSLTDVKRPLLLAEVVGELGRRLPAVHWDHFGAGELENGVRGVAAGFPASVAWTLHGNVANERVLEHYVSNPVDVFLNASSSEGIPVSMMEAMSAGIPIVAPSVGGISEIIDEHSGVTYPANWGPPPIADLLVDAIEAFATVPRSSIRERWEQQFSADRNYREFAAELLERARAAAR